ncbi:hypothetical protein LI095_10170, partial [Veillonella atypica]|uniref:hypothetical protein n=1 Tax=Veillonella atypica TaxID=39777 RepID=UPI001D069412
DKEKTEGYDGGERKRLQQVKIFTAFSGSSLLPAGQPFFQVNLSMWLSFCFHNGVPEQYQQMRQVSFQTMFWHKGENNDSRKI